MPPRKKEVSDKYLLYFIRSRMQIRQAAIWLRQHNIHISKSTLGERLKRFTALHKGSHIIVKKSPTKVSKRDIRGLRRAIDKKEVQEKIDAVRFLGKVGKTISYSHARRLLGNIEDVGFERPDFSRYISSAAKEARVAWAQRRIDHPVNWKKACFLDETALEVQSAKWPRKVLIRKSRGRRRVVRSPKRRRVVTILAFFGMGTNPSCIAVPDNLNSSLFVEALGAALREVPSFKKKTIYLDNNPVHTAKSTREWMDAMKLHYEFLPPYSPDLNPIENCFGCVKRDVYQHGETYVDADAVGRAFNASWAVHTQDTRGSINSMPARLQAVVDARGDVTKY